MSRFPLNFFQIMSFRNIFKKLKYIYFLKNISYNYFKMFLGIFLFILLISKFQGMYTKLFLKKEKKNSFIIIFFS